MRKYLGHIYNGRLNSERRRCHSLRARTSSGSAGQCVANIRRRNSMPELYTEVTPDGSTETRTESLKSTICQNELRDKKKQHTLQRDAECSGDNVPHFDIIAGAQNEEAAATAANQHSALINKLNLPVLKVLSKSTNNITQEQPGSNRATKAEGPGRASSFSSLVLKYEKYSLRKSFEKLLTCSECEPNVRTELPPAQELVDQRPCRYAWQPSAEYLH